VALVPNFQLPNRQLITAGCGDQPQCLDHISSFPEKLILNLLPFEPEMN